MTARRLLPLLALGAAACAASGPDPVGDWSGTITIEGTDREEYTNSMHLAEDGDATVTLYSLDQESYIYGAEFEGTWFEAADITVGLECQEEGCAYSPALDCVWRGEQLACDLTPDLYEDDVEVLHWTRDF
jgi:hypothetical protein